MGFVPVSVDVAIKGQTGQLTRTEQTIKPPYFITTLLNADNCIEYFHTFVANRNQVDSTFLA